jgi:lysyl-tRNA synthetase class 1
VGRAEPPGRRRQGRRRSAAVYARASGTSDGPLPVTPRPLPFRTLASVADITAGDQAQILRILRDLTEPDPVVTLAEVRPRLDCAQAWVAEYVPPADRTQVRAEPDYARLAALTESERGALKLLTEGMTTDWSLDGLTTLLYGIPKLQLGLPITAPPTPELKEPAGLVHPAVPVADRQGHRSPAAHPAAGPGPGSGPLAADPA